MRVDPKEFAFPALVALGLALVTSVPYLLGHLLPFPDSRFNENLVFDMDMNAYFAFARQSAMGQWLFYNPMTPEPHSAVFFNLEWLLLGKLAALFGNSFELAFQVQRIGSIFLFSLALYWLSSFPFDTISMRRIVFTAIMLGGGFGWVVSIPGLGALLPDRLFLDSSAGLHPFFWMLLAPHFLVAQSLVLLALCFFLRAEAGGGKGDYLLAAAFCLFAGATRPFEMLYLVVAISLYLLVLMAWKQEAVPVSRHALRSLVFCFSIPLLIYYVWLLRFHDVFRWWGIQNVLVPPLPGSLALSLGLAFVLLISGLGNLLGLKERPSAHLLIACCFISSLSLLYSFPMLTFSVQFLTTLLIPTVLVGSIRLEPRLIPWLNRDRRRRGAIAAVLLANSLSSMVLLGSYSADVVRGEFRTDSRLIDAYDWLEQNSSPGDVVLASCGIGNEIPRYTHDSSFCGYFFNTVGFRRKREMVQKFFSAETSDAYRWKLLRHFKVRYVVSPGSGGQLAGDELERMPFLRKVHGNDLVTVFEVNQSGGALRGRTSPHSANALHSESGR